MVDAAVERARRTKRPALLRVHNDVPVRDPWRLLPAAESTGEPFFAWHDGASGLCAAAWGTAQLLEEGQADRFIEAENSCSELREQLVEAPYRAGGRVERGLPLALAAFRFARGEPSGALNIDSPPSRLLVPRVLVARTAGSGALGSTAAITVRVGPKSTPGEVLASLDAAVEELRRAVESEPGPGETDGALAHRLETPPRPPTVQQLESRGSWTSRVEAAVGAIREGDAPGGPRGDGTSRRRAGAGCGGEPALQKVVLARAARWRTAPGWRFDTRRTLLALRRQHPSALCFALGVPGGGCFLGASPETLVRVSGEELVTHALAGTAPRGATAEADDAYGAALIESAKDQSEHALVTEMLRATLAPLCDTLDIAPRPTRVRLAGMQHLTTPIRGRLRSPGRLLELVGRLHPTPAVGGWPGPVARRWLAEREPLDRGLYAGPIGWVDARGDGVFAVAIRSALVRSDEAIAFVGAGIVAGSEPDTEWRETELKLSTVAAALQQRRER